MKMRHIATLFLKLMALYVILQLLQILPALFQWGVMQKMVSVKGMEAYATTFDSMFVFLIAIPCVYLGVSISLFIWAHQLSRFLVMDCDEAVLFSGEVSEEMQTWSLRCFGVYALITWGPDLLQVLCQTIIFGTWQNHQLPFLQRFYSNGSKLISPSLGVVLGMLLIFKAKGLMRLIQLSCPLSRQRMELENSENRRSSES